MSYSTKIAAIKAIIVGVTGVPSGNVYDYERHAKDWSSYISSFKDTSNNKIHGYIITRNQAAEVAEVGRTNEESESWLIRGYYSLGNSGATEKTFQALIDDIRSAFRGKITVSGTVWDSDPLQIDRIENLMFGSVLVHYMEARLVTRNEITY